jgi:uncharacterized glyoxalase superfamily protein PhnB
LSKTVGGFPSSVPGVSTTAPREEAMSATRSTIIPALRYRDADAGLQFLEAAFGAEPTSVHRDGDGVIRHAVVKVGGGLVMVGQAAEEGWLGGEPARPLASTVSLYVVVPDPDAHHERAVAAGANVVRPLEDMEYGSREYSVRDSEGNLWSFGTYDPYASG